MAGTEVDREQYIRKLEAELSRIKRNNLRLENEIQNLQSDLVRFSKAFYASNAGMVITRMADGVFIDLNDSFANSLGYEKEDIIGKSTAELGIWIDPGDKERRVRHRAENGFVKDWECKFRKKSGEIGIAIVSTEAADINGETYLFTSGIDITKQKKVEEKFYKAFHENQVPMSITRVEDGVLVDANRNYAETMGYRREDIIGKSNYSDLNICGLSHEERQKKLNQLKEAGFVENLELQVKRGNGEIGHVISTHSLLNLDGELCRLTSTIDITDRKNAEEALAKSEQKFATVFYKNKNVMVITRFEDGIIFDINDGALDLLGYKRADLLGKNIKELGIWAESFNREIIIEQLRNKSGLEFETKYIKRSGKVGTVLAKVDLMELEGVKFALISGTDITERKKNEEELAHSQELLTQIFNNMPLPIVISDMEDGTVMEVNDTLLAVKNLKREDIIGSKSYSRSLLQYPEDMDKYKDYLKKNRTVRNFETKYNTPTGPSEVLLSGVIVNWKGKECTLTVSNNISELRQYQREMTKLDNLNLMGQMAAGVAHEVRNPMTAIKGFLQLFHENEKYAEDKESIELMVEELDRVNDIITTFLSIARNKTEKLRLLNLNNKVKALLPLITSDARKADINIKTEFGDTQKVMLDKGEFRQLLLNLTHNGIQAMIPGGNLTIKTFQDENGVNLTVKDEGKGIPSEVLEKLGTPFLTTKDHGTGLGLALCYSIAERHKARITVDTSPQGTTFKVIFPHIKPV